jgi:hypothetical protein
MSKFHFTISEIKRATATILLSATATSVQAV